PRKYSAPTLGIHGARSTNWKSPLAGLNWNQSGTETRKPASATPFAIQRIVSSFCLLTSRMATAPTSGVNKMIDSRGFISSLARLKPSPYEDGNAERPGRSAPPSVRLSSHEQIHGHECKNAEHHQHRVVLHEPGLEAAEGEARLLHDPADQVHETVDHRAIG